jgi:hypothetical protein
VKVRGWARVLHLAGEHEARLMATGIGLTPKGQVVTLMIARPDNGDRPLPKLEIEMTTAEAATLIESLQRSLAEAKKFDPLELGKARS